MKTTSRALLAILAIFGAVSCSAQSMPGVQPELTDGAVPFARYGQWTIYQSSSEMFDNALSCAAVATLPGSYDAIRVERVADGYIYGMNGFDRESFGQNGEYPIAVWFDDDTSQRAQMTGRFVKDPAFPDDDWLSVYREAEDYESPLDGIIIANTVTFEVENAGNRTGNDAVETSFPVGTFEVVQRSLDRCYEMGMAFAQSSEGPIPACRDEATRLPLSGLCQSSAAAYINIVDGPEPELADDSCTWVLNDGWLAGSIVLYRAVECDGRTSRLAGAVGAHMAQLELIETAYGDASEPYGKLAEPIIYADVYTGYKDSPAADVQARALYGRQREVPKSCAARKMTDVADGYFVDVSPAERKKQPADEPPAHLCGDYGYGDDADLWRVFQGMTWFFHLGQDVQEIDYRSLTLIEPDGEGGWNLVEG